MRAIRYSFEEAVASLWRRRRSSSLSVATITAAILVLGALLMAGWNLDGLLARWAAAAEMSVYLGDDVTPEARATVEQMFRESDLVTEFEFVSKEEALARFTRDFADLAAVAEQGAGESDARLVRGAGTDDVGRCGRGRSTRGQI